MEYPICDRIVKFLSDFLSFKITNSDESILTLSEIEIYPSRRKVYCSAKEIKLTPKEYDILHYLIANKGIVLTYSQIYQAVWKEETLGNEKNAICCHIYKLKRKILTVDPSTKFYIECVRGVGYYCNAKI